MIKYLPLVVIAVVVIAVGSGFFFIGSPVHERARRFDERRIHDLQMLQSEIINYWRFKNVLPRNLDALKDAIRGFEPPQDPETNAPYEYRVMGALSFELCAAFNRTSEENNSGVPKPAPEPYGHNWEHAAGKACFTRMIDRDLYSSGKMHFVIPAQ